MLRFLTIRFPQIKLIFGQDPPVDYDNEQKQTILRENHDEIIGHLGIHRTVKRIQEHHHWTNLPTRKIKPYQGQRATHNN